MNLTFKTFLLAGTLACCFTSFIGNCHCLAQQGPDILNSGSFERFNKASNGWAGVDEMRFLRTFEARATVVTGEGVTSKEAVPCTPCVADLNGDGLLDLVVADARGLTWYFPNSGTKTEPRFTSAEIVPLMLSNGWAQCLGMEAVQFDEGAAFSLAYGDWLGQIFYVPNLGSKAEPRFMQPPSPTDYLVRTTYKGNLWGNYFFPTLYDWDQDGRKDLIVGEGTYSANSIWLFLNQGSNLQPVLNEKEGKRIPLVRGLGREHLTPVVVDWNQDGKPDIVTGEREGGISVYINESALPGEYKFREPFNVRIGNQDKLGKLSRFRFGDLNGDGLPDLVVGRSNGRIGLSINHGKRGVPVYDDLRDITGTNPFTPYAQCADVSLGAPVRSTFHLLRVVSNIKEEPLTFEEGFEPPPGSPGKHAVKLEFCDPKAKYFPNLIPLVEDGTEGGTKVFSIVPKNRCNIMTGKTYTISFWAKGYGFRKTRWAFHGSEGIVVGKDEDGLNVTESVHYRAERDFSLGADWVNVRGSFRLDRKGGQKGERAISCILEILCDERGTLYLDDLTVKEGDSPF
ncbi:MAG TPA: VCBS repeat-containing protein [Candidatus Methylacidiphilales bacterium]|nr:VCBS repeat-containing protein [Candidatus Methylacidiphilales bacterium]